MKPEYDAGKNLKDQMDAAVALYEEDCSLQSIADVLNLNPIKVRKLLITAGVYESEVAEKVQDTFERYRKTQDYKTSILSTATVLGLSKASVTSYLPYEKGVYFPNTADKGKISVGAERQRRYRAMKRWRTDPTEDRIGKSYNDYIADHQMNMFEDFIGYQSSTVLDEPEREAGTTSIPIPQCEESENIPLPDLSEQPENVQRPGSEVVEKGLLT